MYNFSFVDGPALAMLKAMRITFGVLALALTGSVAMIVSAQQGPKEDIKDAGKEVKKAGKATGRAAKKTGSAAKKTTKKAVNKTADKVEEGANKVKEKTK
jgi:hypothetical protein